MTVEPVFDLSLVGRIALASVLGALVGIERERHGQAAGMRTHALVACGAALFTTVGAAGVVGTHPGPNVDPMRVAAQIVSGIGFIGAGAILRDGGSIRGITTAAALWTSAALGMACGAGQLGIALAGAAAVLLTLVALRTVRDRGLRRLIDQTHNVAVVYERGHGTMGPLVSALERAGAIIEHLAIEDDEQRRRVEVRVRTRRTDALSHELEALEGLPEIDSLEFGVAATTGAVA